MNKVKNVSAAVKPRKQDKVAGTRKKKTGIESVREVAVLVKRGRERGFVSLDEINSGLPEAVLASAPAIEAVYALFESNGVEVIDAETGDVAWESLLSPPPGRSDLDRLADVDGQLAAVGQDIYAAGYQGTLASVAAESGQVLWQQEISTFVGVAADWTNLYTADENGEIIAMTRRSGTETWRQAALLRRWPTLPMPFHTTVVTGDFQGYLHFFSNVDGEPVARTRLGKKAISGAPYVDSNRLFVQSDSGSLHAFVVVEPEDDSPEEPETANEADEDEEA